MTATPTRKPATSGEQILRQLDAHRTLAALHDPEPGPQTTGWDGDPTPLTARRLLPPFPVDALPGWVADQVLAVSEFTQTPHDLAGCVALACLSTAAGGRAVVEVRPGWREPVNLYLVVALPPGSRKSAVFAAMTGPLLAAERRLVDQARPAIVEAELARKIAHRDAERYATTAADTTNPQTRAEALAMATDAALHADEQQVAVTPRLIADDITTEAAASLLAEQHGRLAILSAEGGIFGTLAGRYSGGVPSLEVFLKGHAGDLLRVDRKGRPAEHIEHPALTLGLALQPEVLRDIARIPGFRGRGLLARILYSLPENTVGRRRIGTPAVPARVLESYDRHLQNLVLTLAHPGELALIPLSRAANDRVLDLERTLEPRLAPHAELGHITDWAAKLTGATCRMAGLLHLAAYAPGAEIQPATIDDAARLGHYYLTHALAVFDTMGADPLLDGAAVVLDWILRTGRTGFTRREAFTGLSRARFRTVADLDPALDHLVDHGFIRLGVTPAPARGRPPSAAFEVHPRAAKAAQTAEPSAN